MAAVSLSSVSWMNGCSGWSSAGAKSFSISALSSTPTARSSVVTGIFRLRSTLTLSRSLLLVSNSSQAPRFGITLAANSIRPVAGSSAEV